MLASSMKMEVVKFFLNWVQATSLDIRPSIFMSDCDQAQIVAIEQAYPLSWIFLCTWHVLRAMWCHFVTDNFKLLWEKVQIWVKTSDSAKFSRIWDEISSDPLVPKSLIEYFKTEWIPVTQMWSRVSRQNRHIFEEGDTNMLIEAYVILSVAISIVLKQLSRYHHVLKSRWLDGKRNCHLDHIVFTLVKSADPYYQFRHERQEAGLDGLNLEKSHQKDIEDMAKTITRDLIESFDDSQFHVASQTKLGHFYSINLAPPKCNCPDFPHIRFCKHIGAVYFHFPHLRPADVPAPSPSGVPNEPQRAPNPAASANKFHSLVQDVNTLSNKLISEWADQSAPSPTALEAVRCAKASLTAAVASVQGSNPLPHRELIAPNQHSWMETAKKMGTQKAVKRRRPPKEVGLTEKTIGIAKGKHCRVYTDPYAGGERPGKLAKPNAVSAAANQKAHTPPLAHSQPAHALPSPPAVPLPPATQVPQVPYEYPFPPFAYMFLPPPPPLLSPFSATT
jgi:hypothetical protein